MAIQSLLFFQSKQPREIWVLFWGWLISNFAFAMVIPFISIYFLDVLKVDASHVGIFFAIATLARSLSQLISGELSDHFGRRRLMFWGQYLRGLTFFLVIPAIYFHWGFLAVSGILYVNYFFGGIYQTVGNAAVSDWTTSENRLEGFAFTRIGGNLGWALGPAIGGLFSNLGYEFLFFLAAVTSLVSGSLIYYLMPKDTQQNTGSREKLSLPSLYAPLIHNKAFSVFSFASLCLFICVGQIISTFAVFTHQEYGISNSQLGILFSLNGFMIVFFQLGVSSVTKKFNQFKVIIWGSILFGASYMTVGMLPSFSSLFVVMIFITLAEMMTIPSSVNLVSQMSPSHQTGRYMGIYSLLSSISWSLGPVIGTGMMSLAFSGFLIWIIIGSFGLIGAYGFLKSKRLTENKNQPVEISVPF